MIKRIQSFCEEALKSAWQGKDFKQLPLQLLQNADFWGAKGAELLVAACTLIYRFPILIFCPHLCLVASIL